jgi:kinesin family protein 3/17
MIIIGDFLYSVVECFPSRGAIEITNPNAKDIKENKKLFTYDAVYDWK